MFDLENMYKLQKDLEIALLCKKVFSFSADTYMSPLVLPRRLLNKIVMKSKKNTKMKRRLFLTWRSLKVERLMNHLTNDERYDKETCEQGWQRQERTVERLTRVGELTLRRY